MLNRIIPMFLGGHGYPVEIDPDLRGDGGRRVHGVTALVVTGIDRPWCLIADHPENEGVSATNAFQEYAAAVCKVAGMKMDEIFWFELDSMGRYDAWNPPVPPKESAGFFKAINETAHNISSYESFVARLDQLGLRHDGNGLRMMIDMLREPFMPVGGMRLC